MAKNIDIKVKAEDQASGPLNKVSGNINALTKNIKTATQPLTNLGKSLKGLSSAVPGIGLVTAAVAGVTAAVKKAIATMSEWEVVWSETEKAVTRLDFASRINSQLGESSRSLQNFTSDLSNTLKDTFSGGELNEAVATLAFDKNATQIRQIITAAADLSVAMGTDLNTAVTQLNNTFSGTTGSLGKMFPELKSLSSESLAAGDAVAIVADKVKGMAEEMSNSVSGSMLSSKNLTSDLKEELGYWVSDFFEPIRREIDDIKLKWRDALSIKRTTKEAKSAVSSGKATSEDYGLVIADLRNQIATKTSGQWDYDANIARAGITESQWDELNKKRRDEINQLNILINQYVRTQGELEQAEKKAAEEAKKKAAGTSSTGTASTSTTTTTTNPVVVKTKTAEEIRAELKAQIDANAQAMQEYTDHIHEQNDYYVETMIAYNKAREEEAEKEKQRVAGNWSTYGGEVGSYVSAAMTEGPMGVLAMAVQSILQKLQEESGIINALFNSVSTFFDYIIEPLVNILEPILNPILTIIQGQGQVVAGIIELLQPFTDIITPIMEVIGGAVYWIKTFLTNIISYINYGYTEVYNGIIRIYNAIALRDKEYREQTRSLEEINESMKGLFNGDFLDDYKAMLESNYGLAGASTTTSGSATYNAARDIYVTINFNESFVNGDAQAIAIELEHQIQKAYKMNLI